MENKYKITVLSKEEYLSEAGDKNCLVHQENRQTINDVIFFDDEKAKEYVEFKNRKKISKRTKDFIIDYLEQRKKEHESNICGKSTDDYFKEYVDDYCDAIEIIKNLSEGE